MPPLSRQPTLTTAASRFDTFAKAANGKLSSLRMKSELLAGDLL